MVAHPRVWGAVAAIAVAALVGLSSRNPNVIVAVALIALLIVAVLGATYVVPEVRSVWAKQAEAERVDRERRENLNTRWSPFTEPSPSEGLWVYGVERRTPFGRLLERHELHRVAESDLDARAEAEGDVFAKAVEYNSARDGWVGL